MLKNPLCVKDRRFLYPIGTSGTTREKSPAVTSPSPPEEKPPTVTDPYTELRFLTTLVRGFKYISVSYARLLISGTPLFYAMFLASHSFRFFFDFSNYQTGDTVMSRQDYCFYFSLGFFCAPSATDLQEWPSLSHIFWFRLFLVARKHAAR
jgi:hypothetical protein